MIDITRSAFSVTEHWMEDDHEHTSVIVSRWVGFDDDDYPDMTVEQVLCVEGIYPLDPQLNGVPGDYHAWKVAQQSPAALEKFRREQVRRDEDYESASRNLVEKMIRRELTA